MSMGWDAYAQFVLSLIFVLGLILGLGWVVRRFGLGSPALSRSRRRLKVVEMIAVDPKRRLVLVRRDDREHLLLIGGATDVAVEAGIVGPADSIEEAKP